MADQGESPPTPGKDVAVIGLIALRASGVWLDPGSPVPGLPLPPPLPPLHGKPRAPALALVFSLIRGAEGSQSCSDWGLLSRVGGASDIYQLGSAHPT